MSEATFDNAWPKSVRLNKENRHKFIEVVTKDLMPPEKKPRHGTFSEDWGDRVYEATYGPYSHLIAQLPGWMFLLKDEFHVDLFKGLPAKDPIASEHNGVVEFKMTGPRPVINEEVYRWQSSSHMAEIDSQHEVVQAYKDFCQACDDWDARATTLNNTLTEVVEACNTSHQLFRAWPKAVKYAEECFPYVEPAEVKRGGQTSISADELDLTAKLAQTVVGIIGQN